MTNRWFDFFFGENALQNYLSELFGILIAILVVDRLIQFRTKRANRPLRDMCCVMIFEMADNFIAKYLPKEYDLNGASSKRFGSYYASGGVYAFQEEKISLDEIAEKIKYNERERWEKINWPWTFKLSEQSRQSEEDNLKVDLMYIKKYGKAIEEFILKHQTLIDNSIVQKLSSIRFEIVTSFKTYYEPLKPTYSASFGVDMLRLLPKITIESIELSLYLQKCYGHKVKNYR